MWRFRVWEGEFQRLGRGIHHYTPVGSVADGDCYWRKVLVEKYHIIRNRQDLVSAKTQIFFARVLKHRILAAIPSNAPVIILGHTVLLVFT